MTTQGYTMKLVNPTLYQDTGEFDEVMEATQQLQPSVDTLSQEVSNIIRMVNLVTLSSLISLFGIAANVVNMIVFYRQGFNTNTNISFFALAVSDMVCLVSDVIFAILLNPYLETSNIQFIPEEVQHLSVGWFHVCFCRITSWITVFITAERCLGITMPLKVKQIITLRRTTVAMCLIFAVNLSALFPDYVTIYWDWRYIPGKNRTLLGVMYRSYRDQTVGVSFALTSTSGTVSFICVIFLTIFLVAKLTHKSKWRNNATGRSDNSETVSSRDKKIIKIVITISCVLIVCYIPGTTVSFVSSFIPEFSIDNALVNTYFSCWSIVFVFDAINSSVNVFLYYRMSSKYRETFDELFAWCKVASRL